MKALSILKYVFSTVGIAMLIGAAMTYKSTSNFLAEALSAQGTVIALAEKQSSDSMSYSPVVQFVDRDGQRVEFTSSIGSSPAGYSVGEPVEVLYLPANPQRAKINDFSDLWGMTVFMAVMGVPFFSVGVLVFLVSRLKNRKKDYLQQNGEAVAARFQSVASNQKVSINGRHPFVVVCHWLNPETSEVHVFESENIWFDPSSYIKGEELMVFIKRGNPKKYHVDISFLPKMAR